MSAADRSVGPVRADGRPATVLVVDDSAHIRTLVVRQLSGVYHVVEARDGTEALARFDNEAIDVVLLDLNMPGMDGYETAAALRQRPAGRRVPILALTGLGDPDALSKALGAGCTSYLCKPVRQPAILAAVDAALRHAADPPPIEAHELPHAHGDAGDMAAQPDPLVADLLPTYLREKREQVTELRQAVSEYEMTLVGRIAHDIKGTGGAYGMPALAGIATSLEQAARDGDSGRAARLIEQLDIALARAQHRGNA